MQRTCHRAIVRAAVALLSAALVSGAPSTAYSCDTNRGLEPAGKALPRVAEALREGRRLDILAVGSATMLGPRIAASASFPARTVQMLHAARPDLDVRLITHAERGASAVDLLAILRREIAAHPAALVLWQTGTAEAARGRPPAEFEATLQEGVRAALAAGSDIVLIDPPFSRLLSTRADPARYTAAFLDAASVPGAVVFSRYDLTRRWVESGELDPERAMAADRGATLARLHECLAQALSRGLLAAAGEPAPSTASR